MLKLPFPHHFARLIRLDAIQMLHREGQTYHFHLRGPHDALIELQGCPLLDLLGHAFLPQDLLQKSVSCSSGNLYFITASTIVCTLANAHLAQVDK